MRVSRTNPDFSSPSGGQIMALLLQERPSGWEDGRTKKWGLPKQTPEVILDLKPLSWFLAVWSSLLALVPASLSPSRRTPA
jgi:hypothetical protein